IVDAKAKRPSSGSVLLRVAKPYLAFARAMQFLFKPAPHPKGVQAGANVDKAARVSPTATVMPGAYVGANAEIGAHTVIFPNATVLANARVGQHGGIGKDHRVRADLCIR